MAIYIQAIQHLHRYCEIVEIGTVGISIQYLHRIVPLAVVSPDII